MNERKEKGKKNGRKAIFFLLRFFSVPKTVELCGPISLAWKLIDSKNKPLFHRRTHLCGEVIQFFNARGGSFFYGRSAVRKWISLRCECFTTWKKMPASAGLRVRERRVFFQLLQSLGIAIWISPRDFCPSNSWFWKDSTILPSDHPSPRTHEPTPIPTPPTDGASRRLRVAGIIL